MNNQQIKSSEAIACDAHAQMNTSLSKELRLPTPGPIEACEHPEADCCDKDQKSTPAPSEIKENTPQPSSEPTPQATLNYLQEQNGPHPLSVNAADSAVDEEEKSDIADLLGDLAPLGDLAELERQPHCLDDDAIFVLNTTKPDCVEEALRTLLNDKVFGKAVQPYALILHGKAHKMTPNTQHVDVRRIDESDARKTLHEIESEARKKISKFDPNGVQRRPSISIRMETKKHQQLADRDRFNGLIINNTASAKWLTIRRYKDVWFKVEPNPDWNPKPECEEDECSITKFGSIDEVESFLRQITKERAEICICRTRQKGFRLRSAATTSSLTSTRDVAAVKDI